jgi:sulfocyanin SoxE-like protein
MSRILHRIRLPVVVAFAATLLACAHRGQAAPTAPQPPPASTPPVSAPAPVSPPGPAWLAVDSATRTVGLTLEVTAPPGSPSALINGYRAGEAQIVVPLGWTVKWSWHNADSTSAHSLVVMVQREKIPLEGGRPTFSNAMTRMVTDGLPPGQTDQTTFVADEAGWFWMLCGVPGHALKGEWIELRVGPDAKSPSVQIKGVNGKQ